MHNHGFQEGVSNSEAQLPPQKSKEEVHTELSMLRQEIYLMGANDSEIPTLNRIIEQHERGEIGGEEALKMAHGIFSSKADYH